MRSSKKPRDLNKLAASIVGEATADSDEPMDTRNPAAVALGRLGGLKGGRARAKSLSAEARSKIAANAARARWSRAKESDEK